MTLPRVTVDAVILSQEKMAEAVYRMTLDCPQIAQGARPGNFVQMRPLLGNVLLRRPLGIGDAEPEKGRISLVYRVLGRGTGTFSGLSAGDRVNVLGPLGHGFSMDFKRPLLVGGGMGLSPLLFYAGRMGGKAEILMGGKNASEMFWTELFAPYAAKIHVATDDGSLGEKGFPTDLLPDLLKCGGYDGLISCGPEIMMKKSAKIARAAGLPCQVSLERRMACGLGACLSCSIDTRDGTRKKVCKDGPVFWAEEVFP